MSELQLSLGCIRYDRTNAVLDGKLSLEGAGFVAREIVDHDSSWLIPIRYRVFDVAEMPLADYAIGLDQGHTDWIALPIFLSRSFRHSTLYVNKKANIRTPRDLEGKRVGIGNFFGSTTLWARGLLSDQYQVDLKSIQWVTKNKVTENSSASSTNLQFHKGAESLEKLLEAGDIDALISERAPQALQNGLTVGRLFENYKTVEIDFYQQTKIFPIRHVLALKREIYDKNPWLGQSLYKMFDLAKNQAGLDHMFDGHSKFMIPSLQYALAETKKIFGNDPWPYGLEKSRATLEAFTKYCHLQGYTSKHLTVDEMFASHIMSV